MTTYGQEELYETIDRQTNFYRSPVSGCATAPIIDDGGSGTTWNWKRGLVEFVVMGTTCYLFLAPNDTGRP